jgi:uncharacterized protein (TIGR00369 family)
MTVNEQLFDGLKEMARRLAGAGVALELPPPTNRTLGMDFVAIEPGKSLTSEFRFDPRFSGPLGIMQGGILSAAIDDTFGPLTYLAAQAPVMTIEMSTTYLRPFTAKDEVVRIHAEIVSKTKTLMVLKAEVRTREGKLVATSTTHSLIADEARLKAPVRG